MEAQSLERLAIHVSQIVHSLIQQLHTDGIIRSLCSEKAADVDIIASHHLAELLIALDRDLFGQEIEAILNWLANPANGVSDSPFTIDIVSQICAHNAKNENILKSTVASGQLMDGSFTKYTAHLKGGDFFSTLWCTKILLNYSKEIFAEEISRALDYLLSRREIAARDVSQLGFLGQLLIRANSGDYDTAIGEIFSSISKGLGKVENRGSNAVEFIGQLYLLEDFIDFYYYSHSDEVLAICEAVLMYIFDLDQQADRLPRPLETVKEKAPPSLLYQIFCRGSLVGYKFCKARGYDHLPLDINWLIHGNYIEVRRLAITAQAEAKMLLEKYRSIHEGFEVHNAALERVWEKTPFEKSIFLMMPFRSNLEFRILTDTIRRICTLRGFRAVRADDRDRQFCERLWDNLVVNMLSCRYAIAIYVSDTSLDKIEDRALLFSNPNIALEFGFFKSRAQEVLILKDKKSNLPTDLQGFLWNEFDIENPDATIELPLTRWLDRLDEFGGSIS